MDTAGQSTSNKNSRTTRSSSRDSKHPPTSPPTPPLSVGEEDIENPPPAASTTYETNRQEDIDRPPVADGSSWQSPAALASQGSLPSRPPPPTPSSNFDINPPELSSDSDEENDGDEDDIFPADCEIGNNLRELARRRLQVRDSPERAGHEWGSASVFGDNGSIHSAVIRRRRQLLEGRVDDDGPKDVVICVIWASNRFAAAYYDLETAQLFMLPDIYDAPPDFGVMRSVFSQVNPTYVLVNKSSDDRFLKAVYELTGHKIVGTEDDDDTNEENQDMPGQISQRDSIHLYPLASKEFAPDVCKQRVHLLKLPFEPKNSAPQEHLMFVTSLIPFSNENMVRAMGTLLKFLDRSAIELFQIELVMGQIPVVDVKLFKMDDLVIVDDTAWRSMQIFSTDFHPSTLKQGSSSGSKEGLSVFGLLNQCITAQGAKKLRLMMLRPSRNIELLSRRYDVIEYCMSVNHHEFMRSTMELLKSVKSIPKLLYRLSLLHATVNEWKELYQTMYHCLLLGELCGSRDFAPDLIKDIGSPEHLTTLRTLTQEMIRMVDFDESIMTGRIVARQGIDQELDKKKRQYSCLPEIMSIVASEEMTELPTYVTQCCVVYIPEVGYLLAVTLWRDDLRDHELALPNLEFRFKTHELAYYKSSRMRELDVVLGDCSVAILEMETVIMVRMTEMILQKSATLLKLSDIVSELDCLIAISIIARNYNFVRPVILPPGGRLKIVDGRHPISDIIREFVPNSTVFKDEEKVVVLTGPNASGKSVYLKQIGVIVIMALCGSYVPAHCAQIPVYDRICTRIHAIESVSTGFSTFMTDINQMALALRSAGRNSLVIIDEFGKGTTEADGVSILVASMQDFIDRMSDCPTVFLSTHFFSVIKYLKESPFIKFQTMNFIDENGSITYLYELKDGYCESSFAQLVAKAQGVPLHVVERAGEIEAVTRGREKVDKIKPKPNPSHDKVAGAMLAIADEFLSINLCEINPVAYLQRVKRVLEPFMK